MALALTIDCARPDVLVAFWGPLLGLTVPPPPAPHATWKAYYVSLGEPPESIEGDGNDRLVDADGTRLWFQVVPEAKTVKNRLHLDVTVSTAGDPYDARRAAIETAVADVLARGGSLLYWNESPEIDHVGVTMADPEGNEFCLR